MSCTVRGFLVSPVTHSLRNLSSTMACSNFWSGSIMTIRTAGILLRGSMEACRVTTAYVREEYGVANVVIKGKVMHEQNRVVLIDVYEGPANSERHPVTHQEHIELPGLPPRHLREPR